MTVIEIINKQDKVAYDKELENVINSCIRKTLETENITFDVEISVTLVDNEEIRRINDAYRGIDRETDVLSFPMLSFNEENRKFTKELLEENLNRDTGAVILGDIIISLEKALEQAEEYGHSFPREVGFLTVHSMLHLLGYDHNNDTERVKMHRQEEAILSSLNLTRD